MEKREVMKTWELSLYELQRRPQEAVTDDTEIKINPRTLHSELMCPICLDVMTNTMTTKECLHRFCSECIITALRNGNKECPTCRKKLVSKRSLRHDPNFDALISKICPDKEQDVDQNGGNSFMNSPADSPIPPQPQSINGPNDDIEDNPDESQNDSSQKRKRSRQSGATNEDGSEPNADSAPNSHRKSSKKDNSDQTSKSRSSTSTAAANSSKTSSVDIILRLKPQPVSASEPKEKGSESTNDSNSADLVENLQPEVLCKFLKTSRDATVQHVAEYLKIRKDEVKEFIPAKWKLESLQEDSKFLLFVRKRQMPQNTQYEYMQLTEDSTLATVMSDYGLAKNKPIELYFSCQQMS